MIAAVFDCMVFLQAATSERSPAFACLELVEANRVRLYVSPAILDEIRDVFAQPEIQAKFPHLTQERAEVFQQKIVLLARIIGEVPDAGHKLRDEDDLPYLNLAIAAGVGWLVTRDKDLLDLMNNARFSKEHPALAITDPVVFLAAVRAAR
jgi:putative PIN family toxin of toxin-antitoxin system